MAYNYKKYNCNDQTYTEVWFLSLGDASAELRGTF